MKWKSKVYNIFCTFKTSVENILYYTIKMFQSDGGRVFDQTNYMQDMFSKHSIDFQKPYHDTQEQNGVAERKHQHLIEIIRLFVIATSLSASFWLDAVYVIVFTINR